MTFPCIKYKIHKYTNTQIHKYANTKCLKDPTCAILFKSMGFKDIKYDIPRYQPILSPTWSQLQHSLQLLHHLADPLGDLIAHIGHLPSSLTLHHHLNDDHQLQIALLASDSSASIELASPSARVTSTNFQKGVVETPGPIDPHRPP